MMEVDVGKRTMRSGEVAEALGLSAATIQAYARRGRIPARLTPGGQYRFDLAEVRAVIEPPTFVTSDDLLDVLAAPIAIDHLSGYRADPIDAASERRLRVRSVRPSGPALGRVKSPAAGATELASLIKASAAAAMVVLHRPRVDA